MKRFVFCLLALTFLAYGAQAAEVNTSAGDKALVFQFSGLSALGLSGYNGGVGARYYLSDGMAIRPGLDIGVSSMETKGVAGFSDEKDSRTSLGLSVALEKHLTGPTAISPYIGAGLGFGMSSVVEEPSVPSSPASGTILKTTDSSTNFGVFVLGGFEWGFTESLTLGGEYRAGLNYGSGDTETERQGAATVKTDETTSLNLGFSTASVYLSVGF